MSNIILDNKQMINSMHHDIQCIESLDPKDKGTSRQFWFSASMLAEIFGISEKTARRRIDSLIEWGEIQSGHFCPDWKMAYENSNLTRDITLYDLTVFNKLAMDLRTPASREIKNKFSDILVEVETTGSYNAQIQSPSYMVEDPIERAKAWIREQEEKRALEDKTKELESENKDLKRTKGQISTRREAVALAEASKASRKNKKLMKELDIKSKELDKANVDREILQTELELACSTMFTNKRVCEMITERFDIKYANSTLKAKTSKALQAIANEFGENIVQRKELVNGDQHYVPYYTPRTYEVLAKRLEDDNKYLRQY